MRQWGRYTPRAGDGWKALAWFGLLLLADAVISLIR